MFIGEQVIVWFLGLGFYVKHVLFKAKLKTAQHCSMTDTASKLIHYFHNSM